MGIIAAAIDLCSIACDSPSPGDPSGGDDSGFEVLVSADWDVEAGNEQNYCLKKTFDHDVTIGSFEALAPPGTHHTIASVGDPDGADGGPDGLATCGSYEHHFESMLYESNTTKDRFDFPDGFAALIPAGQQLNLNFHILNATDHTLRGTTGLRIKRVAPEMVENYATTIFMGKVSLSVPPGESTHMGSCALPDDLSIIAVQPHMHSHATHQKVLARSSLMGDTVILDDSFDFDSSMHFRSVDPEVPMKRNDPVEVYCSYDNNTGAILPWGQGAWDAEMCFAMVYVYPAERVLSSACAN